MQCQCEFWTLQKQITFWLRTTQLTHEVLCCKLQTVSMKMITFHLDPTMKIDPSLLSNALYSPYSFCGPSQKLFSDLVKNCQNGFGRFHYNGAVLFVIWLCTKMSMTTLPQNGMKVTNKKQFAWWGVQTFAVAHGAYRNVQAQY